ncbi:MAG: beta-galactosidase, partial [Planctomycetes bacterium]|nr:beta-galactosidase [Planctomycetota bacterium]
MSIAIENQKLLVDGQPLPLVSGDVHYWRLPRETWPRLLDEVRALGFNVVSTYIPWSVHEFAPGRFDFGDRDPSRDIAAFLRLAAERGFKALVRPGPHINAELTYFGYPKRLFAREECLSRTASGALVYVPLPPRAFPAPSYASPPFYEEVGAWFDAVCPHLRPLLHGAGGPIIGCQADNECSLFFRTAVFDHDYSEFSRKLYRRFLDETYGGEIAALNAAYGTTSAAFSEVNPPTRFEGGDRGALARLMDWARYREHYLVQAIATIRRMLEERGITGVFWFHNYPPGRPGAPPFHVHAAERVVDAQGIDLYQKRGDYQFIKRNCLALAGASRLPWTPEFSSGSTWVIKPLQVEDQEFTARAAFMHGVKGANYYMIVERERWYGSPIAADGRRREEAWRFFQAWLAEISGAQLWRCRRRVDLLLLTCRDYHRLEHVTSLFTPVPPLVLDDLGAKPEHLCREDRFGFSEPVQIENHRQWESWYWGFSAAGYALGLADSEGPTDPLYEARAVIVPAFDFMPQACQQRLLDYASRGGCVVFGPRLPRAELDGRPATLLKDALSAAGSPAREERVIGGPFDTSAGRGAAAPEGFTLLRLFHHGRGRLVYVDQPLA